MKKGLILFFLVLSIVSCGQKSNKKQKEINPDTLQHNSESKNDANKIDKKVINDIEGGTQPTIIDYYDEIYNGEINGHYKLTKSGNWYYVLYIRGRDNKEFNFTVDHTTDILSTTSCF